MHSKYLIIAVFFMIFLPCTLMSENLPEPFHHLLPLKVEHTLQDVGIGDITIHFDKSISTVIDTLYGHPASIKDGLPPHQRLITTMIDRNADTEYYIDFSPGMSADPGFVIFRIDGSTSKKLTPWVAGTQLIIPGDGFLYASGHTNTTFVQRKKYRIEGDTVTEVKLPAYKAGHLKPYCSGRGLHPLPCTIPARIHPRPQDGAFCGMLS